MLADPKIKDQLLDCVFMCPDKYPNKESYISAVFKYYTSEQDVKDPYLEYHSNSTERKNIIKTYFLNVITTMLEGLNISQSELSAKASTPGSKI